MHWYTVYVMHRAWRMSQEKFPVETAGQLLLAGLGRCFFQGLAGAAVDRLLGRALTVQASQWRAGESTQEGKMEGLAAVR